jgi:hypothetical protein
VEEEKTPEEEQEALVIANEDFDDVLYDMQVII